MAIIKADAYGHGAVQIARLLEPKVAFFGVSGVGEALELRQSGLEKPILILGHTPTSAYPQIVGLDIRPAIFCREDAELLSREAVRQHTTAKFHLAVDTGMSRLGFAPDDMPHLIERLNRQKAVIPRSVFSHLAGSDSTDLDAFTHLQAARFQQAADTLQAAFPHKILRHLCNSAGIERFPEYHHDMVRLGLGLYGISPVGDRLLHPISTLKSTILQIHEVSENETVGYSRRGQLTRPSRIAALPIGYADGLNRRLGNGVGHCMVNGHEAPYVGNICMDVCMIDVTDIPCQEGDKVEIFGPQLPVTQLAEWLGTIPYEVMTGISTRVKRVYFTS
jgi:alanine racemase